jgi:hypothetical protein
MQIESQASVSLAVGWSLDPRIQPQIAQIRAGWGTAEVSEQEPESLPSYLRLSEESAVKLRL